jgi:hypothetical protein
MRMRQEIGATDVQIGSSVRGLATHILYHRQACDVIDLAWERLGRFKHAEDLNLN